MTVRNVIEAAKQGDRASEDIIAEAARCLGMGLVNGVNILGPEMVILNRAPLTAHGPFWEVVTRFVTEGCFAGERVREVVPLKGDGR